MDINEPVITTDEILVLKDDTFTPDTVCIVTGAGSGIGRATAVAAAANQLTVVGLDYNEKAGEETKKLCEDQGGRMTFIPCDLTVDEQMDKVRGPRRQNSGRSDTLPTLPEFSMWIQLISFPLRCLIKCSGSWSGHRFTFQQRLFP